MILNPSWLETSFLSSLWISMNFFNFSCWITLFWYLCIFLILHLYVYFFEFWCWICVICSPTTTFGLQLCWFLALFTFKRRHVTRKRFNKVKQQSERKIFQYIFTNHACKEDGKMAVHAWQIWSIWLNNICCRSIFVFLSYLRRIFPSICSDEMFGPSWK